MRKIKQLATDDNVYIYCDPTPMTAEEREMFVSHIKKEKAKRKARSGKKKTILEKVLS